MGANKKNVVLKKESEKAIQADSKKSITVKPVVKKATSKKAPVQKNLETKAELKKKNVIKSADKKQKVTSSGKNSITANKPLKISSLDLASKKVVSKKAVDTKLLTGKTINAQSIKKAVKKKSLLKTANHKDVSTSDSKTKQMKKEDKDKSSKEAIPNVPKNMPLLKQEPEYLQRTMNAPKDDRTHYSKEELKEFDAIISEKLELARKQFQFAKDVLNRKNDEGTDNTNGNVKMLEDGADVLEKESFSSFAARQQKFILQLENAHARIQNGTYGVCIVTGKLIPKERLKLVPHTQHTIEAKEQRK